MQMKISTSIGPLLMASVAIVATVKLVQLDSSASSESFAWMLVVFGWLIAAWRTADGHALERSVQWWRERVAECEEKAKALRENDDE